MAESPGTSSVPRGLFAATREFFFAEETPWGLALVRMALPPFLLYTMLRRWVHAREFFSADGASAPLADNFGYFNFVPTPSGTVAVILATALVFCLVTMMIGWKTRISVTACFVIYTYLNLLDCLGTFTKYSVIASHVMLLLSLSQCGAVWSVDAWLNRSAGVPPPRFAAWPRRLLQLLIGMVYIGAAITKIHTPTFFSGDQLRFWMMTDVNHANPWGEQLTLYPVMLVTMAYVSVIWEILFIFTAWRGHGRWIMLLLGAVFHLMTRQTLGLFIFPWICMTTYLAFINEADVRRWQSAWQRCRQRLGLLFGKGTERATGGGPRRWVVPADWRHKSAWAFSAALLLSLVLGVELEHQLDPYGIRDPEGPHELVELDRAIVAQMLATAESVRPEDLVHSLEIGTWLVGGYVVGHRTTFEQGDRLYAQCTLNPPHPDMVIECNLRDSEDRLLDRVEAVVPRESFRANFLYYLHDSLEPGEYSLVVRCGNREVVRRRITLTARSGNRPRPPVAN